ncbi:hypothetical protein HUJ04_010849 [Dendroctonus ponderosae]|nr:hypothetical protein HUJ04_010849 [Dendroctonus ponderosae]KAH1021318.1 hypothetical protein HUJ04_010849 [Dendroctonus ponderosae]
MVCHKEKKSAYEVLPDSVRTEIWVSPELAADLAVSVGSEEGINLYQFLPYDHHLFYHYRGSLTTPDCKEFVHWIVLKNTANICYLDLKNITNIRGADGKLIHTNNRELQELNNRVVSIRRIR